MFADSFPGARFDPISLCVTPIILYYCGSEFAHGTGFIWRHAETYYLVTNWHNFSGANPFSGAHLNEGGKVPDEIEFFPAIQYHQDKIDAVHRASCKFSLYEDFHNPRWIQHAEFLTHRIDIAAVPIEPNGHSLFHLNQFEEANLFTHVGSDLFIIGYPFRPNDDAKFPIWKRGSLASDAVVTWDNRPAYLIDAASRPGMSGSPVYRRAFGPAAIAEGDGFSVQGDLVLASRFVGIYSGHISDIEKSITIGFAWRRFLVEQVLSNPHPGARL